jgi:integrase
VRVGKGPRIRLKEKYGTPEFDAAYRAALSGEAPAPVKGVSAGTVAWPIERYRDSQAWATLSPATRKLREGIFRRIIEKGGAQPFKLLGPSKIQAALDAQKDTPFQATKFLDAMRGLFKWALEAKHVTVDPTFGIRAKKPKTEGFKVWSEDEVALFERKWPVGTRERLAFDLLVYTGLRRGDVARLGRQHVKDGVITLRTEKTGQVVTLLILPALAESIAATRTGDLAFIIGEKGRPMVKEAFGNWFREVCNAAGVTGSAHGLRKLGATRAADNGATEAQLEAIFGWRGGGMASLYTRQANRKRLAIESMDKIAPRPKRGSSIPAPEDQVRAPGLKPQQKQ